MTQEILEYIKTQRIAVLAIEMLDGAPHASTVHFAHRKDPLVFYFETNRNYRKSEPLFGRRQSRASMVIGVDEGNMKTLQLDGNVELLREDARALFEDVYFAKFPEKKEKYSKPDVVVFTFTPTWWRFTDWTRPGGKFVASSD